jgi:hypothetical protein
MYAHKKDNPEWTMIARGIQAMNRDEAFGKAMRYARAYFSSEKSSDHCVAIDSEPIESPE